MLKVGLETVDSNLSITHNGPLKPPIRNPTALIGKAQTNSAFLGGKTIPPADVWGTQLAGTAGASPPELQSAPRPSRPEGARAQARGSRRGTPRFRTAPLTETLASNHTALETGRRTGTRRLKRRGQGRRGRRSSRDDRPPHPLTSEVRQCGERVRQRPAEVEGSTTATEGRHGPERGTGHGEGNGTQNGKFRDCRGLRPSALYGPRQG